MFCDHCRQLIRDNQKFVTMTAPGKHPLFLHLGCAPPTIQPWAYAGRKMGDSTMMPKGWEPGT